jgi:hypothetical protein
MLRTFLLIVLFAACAGDEGGPAPTPCEQLRDHLIDLRLADASPKVDKDAHRAAMRNAFDLTFFASCSELADAERACALSATTLSDATACAPQEAE